jgi:broad specificity phosphatase PhoE
MKTLEVRRHSMRKHSGGSQLSQEGVDFARRLGATLGPFARVVTSIVPRARETAIAMGFAVDYELVTLIAEDELYTEADVTRWWESPQPFAAFTQVLSAQGASWRYAHSVAAMWRDILTSLPDGGAALVIGHSGQLEAGLVACLPQADHAAWGGPFGPCEGARLVFSGEPERFTSVELLRSERA